MEKFEINKILVPVDLSEISVRAFRQALILAKAADAEVCLFSVINKEGQIEGAASWDEGAIYYSKLVKRISDELDKLMSENSGVKMTKEVKLGNIYKEICDKAHLDNFDLIVMGTHGTSGFNEFFAGSNAYRVVNHAGCPVVTVQSQALVGPFKKIILPIRLERSSRQKVDYIYEMARLFKATVYVTGFTKSKDGAKQDKIRQYVEQVERYLKDLDVECQSTALFEKNFTKAVLDYAKANGGDLIAIMTEHDFSADQMLKGNYTQQFVNHSHITVMSVPVYSNPDLMTYTPYLSGATPY